MPDPAGFAPLGEEVRERGWRFTVVRAEFRAPDGTRFTRDVVRHPGAVAVVPVTVDGDVVLVRQYRPAIDRWLLEIPAGTRDVEGEPGEETARRELAEEAGYAAGRMEHLLDIFNTPGFCDERTAVFLATDLSPVPHDRHGPEEEHLEVVHLPISELDAAVADGRLTDAQTVLGIALARDRWNR